MKNLKKFLCAVLCLALAVCVLGGCSSQKDAQSSSAVSQGASSQAVSKADGEPYKIGLIQFMEHPSLDTIREAFMSRLEEWGYDETKVTVDYQNAAGDTANMNTICQKFVGDKVDMIVAIATPAAQVAVSATEGTDIKVLFAAVNNPQEDLGIKNADAPEGNVTGTSDRLPIAASVDLALKVNPELKTFGLLYTSSESNAVAAADEAKKYCEEKGIQVVEGTISNVSELQQVATDLCTKADAIFSSTDNTIAGSIAVVTEATRKAKTPWYVGADSMVQDGALAAIGIDYTELGQKNADMAVELIEGKSVSQVPLFFFDTYQTYINQDTLDAVEAVFPEDVLGSANFFTDAAASAGSSSAAQ